MFKLFAIAKGVTLKKHKHNKFSVDRIKKMNLILL